MKITRKQLRQLIKESLSSHQSELSYSHTNPPESKKALQKSYWKAHRGPAARADIESQLGSMDVGDQDDRAIGEIVPVGPREWASYDGVPPDPAIPSEKLAYLYDLAYDVADGRVNMSEEDIAALDILTNDEFGWSFSYSVTGHGADFSAEAQRDEFYDTKEEQATTLSELFKGQHKMKITRSQLKNLIKEEMSRIDEVTKLTDIIDAAMAAKLINKDKPVYYRDPGKDGGKPFVHIVKSDGTIGSPEGDDAKWQTVAAAYDDGRAFGFPSRPSRDNKSTFAERDLVLSNPNYGND